MVTFDKLCQMAVDLWGVDAQLDMALEECLELALALIKRHRLKNGSTPQEILGEAVDVEIMSGQLKYIFGRFKFYPAIEEDWEEVRRLKLERLHLRILEDPRFIAKTVKEAKFSNV